MWVAMSIMQGGPGIPLMPEFIVSTDVTKICIDDATIPDNNVLQIVHQVSFHLHASIAVP